ncbi:MAG TPA: hypothetical protein EYG85_08075 [Crocinitomix sp.]|nr:hypothetical protein [Crocinitomix sp.]
MFQEDYNLSIFSKIKGKLPTGDKLVDVLKKELNISTDAAYRRLRGDVPLTLSEAKILSVKYNISLDDIDLKIKGKVSFNYKPLSTIGLNFESYLTNIRDNLRIIKNLENPHIYISVNDTPIFQLFNFPHLTRFKFFFWAHSYLQIPEYKFKKFGQEKIDKRVLQIGIEAHNTYNSIPTTEIYCPEALRGTLRQIEFYVEADMFNDVSYALRLLDNLKELSDHMKNQAKIGHKYVYGNEPNNSEDSIIDMYINPNYLPDNTYYIEHKKGSSTFITHNIMNVISTTDFQYNRDSKFIIDRLIATSTLVSETAVKERNRFFADLNKTIESFRKKIEFLIEQENT